MGINKQIREYQKKILEVVNEEQLPLEIKRLVLAEVMNAVSNAADAMVEQEEEDMKNEQST